MKIFLPQADLHFDVRVVCPWCSERQLQAELEVFRLFGKVLLCENEFCNNHFRLPTMEEANATRRES